MEQNTKISIALKVKAKNGVLQRFIESKNWSQSDFARAIGASAASVGDWFNMNAYPNDIMIIKICELIGESPEVIFPQILKLKQFKRRRKNFTLFKEIEESDFLLMADVSPSQLTYIPNYENSDLSLTINNVLSTLPQRDEAIIRERFFEGLTLKQISKKHGVNTERIRQIEARAMRNLRHPSRSKNLKEYLER